MSDWFFRKLSAGEVRRDASEGEQFKHDQQDENTYVGVDNLVCEVLQNSLDARSDNGTPVKVRFAIHSVQPIERQKYKPYFTGLENPLKEYNTEFDFDSTELNFLVIEDFGTRGLEGDVALYKTPDTDKSKQDFYYFWRNVNRSGKTGGNLGKWGIGKIVYRQASQIGSFFGLTIRQSDSPNPYLMGQAILKIHQKIYQDKSRDDYSGDGYWGEHQGTDEKLTVPFTNTDKIKKFCEDWKITRKNETGLSVVVPYVRSGLCSKDILQTVAVHFFEKILLGELEVEIDTPDSKNYQLTAKTLNDICSKIEWDGNKKLKRHVPPPIEFFKECLSQNFFYETLVLGKDRIPELSAESFEEKTLLQKAIETFQKEQLVAIKVQLDSTKIIKNQIEPPIDCLTIFLQKTQAKEPETYFVRQGMTVLKPKSNFAKTGNTRGYVRIETGILASLLADAEGPAHEDWEASAERVKQNWKTNGTKGRIDFIKKIVDCLYLVLTPPNEKPDFQALRHFFSIPEKTKGKKPIPLPDKPKWYAFTKQKGGFTIKRNSNQNLSPSPKPVLEITVAYDVPRGNAFKKWSKFDFDFNDIRDKENFKKRLSGKGGQIDIIHGNKLKLAIRNVDNFEMKMSGFDKNRDLVVDIKERDESEKVLPEQRGEQ